MEAQKENGAPLPEGEQLSHSSITVQLTLARGSGMPGTWEATHFQKDGTPCPGKFRTHWVETGDLAGVVGVCQHCKAWVV